MCRGDKSCQIKALIKQISHHMIRRRWCLSDSCEMISAFAKTDETGPINIHSLRPYIIHITT